MKMVTTWPSGLMTQLMDTVNMPFFGLTIHQRGVNENNPILVGDTLRLLKE